MSIKRDKPEPSVEGAGRHQGALVSDRPWPVLTRLRRQQMGAGHDTIEEEVKDHSPAFSSSTSFSGVHMVSPSLANVSGSVAAEEPLWELAALGESLSGELPMTPYSPLPAAQTRLHVKATDLLPPALPEADPQGAVAEAAGGSQDSAQENVSGFALAGFQTDAAFAERALHTLQLTPPTYRLPHSLRCPSMRLWCGIARVLATPCVTADHHPSDLPK